MRARRYRAVSSPLSASGIDRMHRLSVLGQIDLRDAAGDEVRSVLAQPKRLALLVYLAQSRPQRVHRRDALLAMFWPEHAEDRARNALRQAIHRLRQSLGPAALISHGGDALGVDPSRLSCDATELEDALDRGLLGDALRLYRGELLPGFSIAGSIAFDQWLEESRSRLRHRAARAAWALAEQHERAGRLDDAAESARRAAELVTDDETAFRQLLSLLDRAGDAAGVIRAYEEFAARLRRELDIEPAPQTRQLVDAVRARGRVFVAAGGTSVGRESPGPSERTTVTIGAFENLTGDATHDFVGRLVAAAVAQDLAATRLVHVAAGDGSGGGVTRAESSGEGRAGLVVEGSYHLVDDSWHLRATIRAAADGVGVGSVAPAAGRRDRPWEAAHELSRRVSGAIAGHLDPRVASWADAVSEPPSLEAHRAHLVGMELHLRGEYRAAISHFLKAASMESGFAMPLLWAIQASCNLEEYEQAALIRDQLVARRARLSPVEQLGCDYFGLWLDGDRGGAFRMMRRIAELLPDSEVLAQLGRDAMFFNRPRFAVETLERLDPERGWMPAWTPYWRRLTEAYHMLGDHARECAAARRGRAQHPESVSAMLYEARAHGALGDVDAVGRAADEAVALASDRFATAGDVMFAAAQELRAHGHPGAGAPLLARALAWQRDHCAQDAATFAERLTLARMCYEASRWDEAAECLAALRGERPGDVDVLGYAGALAARTGDATAARAALSALRVKTGRFHYGKHLLSCARIEAVLGEADAAVTFLRGAFARGYCYGVELHADLDLALLANDERFRELLRPKG